MAFNPFSFSYFQRCTVSPTTPPTFLSLSHLVKIPTPTQPCMSTHFTDEPNICSNWLQTWKHLSFLRQYVLLITFLYRLQCLGMFRSRTKLKIITPMYLYSSICSSVSFFRKSQSKLIFIFPCCPYVNLIQIFFFFNWNCKAVKEQMSWISWCLGLMSENNGPDSIEVAVRNRNYSSLYLASLPHPFPSNSCTHRVQTFARGVPDLTFSCIGCYCVYSVASGQLWAICCHTQSQTQYHRKLEVGYYVWWHKRIVLEPK